MSLIRPAQVVDITTANSPRFLVLDAVSDGVSDEVPDGVSDGVPDELLDGKTPCEFSCDTQIVHLDSCNH
jgi:hypothetical protein